MRLIILIKHNNSGFTVLELITVTVIMTMLLVLVITNFRGFDAQSALNLEADKISSVLRQAQIWALTGQTVSGQRYNYGVHFEECESNSCNYILFYDNDADKIYDIGEEYNSATHLALPGISIDNNNLKIGATNVDELDFVFEAPLGEVYFNNSVSEDTARVILKHEKSNTQKIISVDRISGRINIQ